MLAQALPPFEILIPNHELFPGVDSFKLSGIPGGGWLAAAPGPIKL